MSEIQNNYQKYHSHISSDHKWFDLKLKEVWKYKDLLWLFTKRSFVVTYKQTILGPAWLFINPILTSLIYAFVFGGIAGMGTDGVPQMMFYLPSTAIWTYFSSCVTQNAGTFTGNAGVFGRIQNKKAVLSNQRTAFVVVKAIRLLLPRRGYSVGSFT